MCDMKSSKIKQIPMFKTRYFENGKWEYNDTLSHADYDGEIQWSHERDEHGRVNHIQPTMVENVPWKDVLIYKGYYRGRSAAGAQFMNDKGQRFTVFMTDLDKFIPLMVNGKIEGTFIYCKRGKNYGVTLFTGMDK